MGNRKPKLQELHVQPAKETFTQRWQNAGKDQQREGQSARVKEQKKEKNGNRIGERKMARKNLN